MFRFKKPEDLVGNQVQELERRALEKTAKVRDWNTMRSPATTGGHAALLTSGGWCAPPEVSYQPIYPPATFYETLDLPSVVIRRGGIKFEEVR